MFVVCVRMQILFLNFLLIKNKGKQRNRESAKDKEKENIL